ncbi:DNA-binding LytR/AlgR family response regulator [Planomicrobium stackebrandtii]|uniref:DNA-binding LytR/AlgR family response regulator n=1 Tax=Planomicrobium stackebrandtii TaxID=253160 RepID=A0ABU0GUN1_9BACL|nr:LytTR family DNA-binding domain-containing protein [Planomicrobium stackebrandtii]MDQ0428496.1 DNA-binding LytR/AlgR family response regulator [Planomicrobium stackebrandtii]
MKVSLNIDSGFKETKVIIECSEMDDSIKSIIDFIKGQDTRFLVGRDGDMQHILKPAEIHYFHTNSDTVAAVTEKGEFRLKEKLYELEEVLPPSQFIRLSKSVIANLDELSRFEASFNGTLCVYFKSGAKEYVSRNYVNAIKESLKMNRRKEK